MPPDPPANLFWSLTAYDAETAAGVNADGQAYPSLNSMNELAVAEAFFDGKSTSWATFTRPGPNHD